MVRDRIVFGINNPQIREKYINKGNELTVNSAIEIAQTHEVSRQRLKQMDGSRDVYSVRRNKYPTKGAKSKTHNSSKKQQKSRIPECSRCGNSHNQSDTCPAIGQECHKCHRRNHFANKCRSRKKVHTVREDSTDSEDSQGSSDFHVGEVKEGHQTTRSLFP